MIQLLYYHMKMLVINKSMTVEHFNKLNFMKYNRKKSQFCTTLQKEFHKRESFQRTILRSCKLIKMIYRCYYRPNF